MPPGVRFYGKNAPNSISDGAPTRPRWGSLHRSTDLLAVFQRPTSRGREEKEGEGKGWCRKRKGSEGTIRRDLLFAIRV